MKVADFQDRKVAQVTTLARALARTHGAEAFAALRREVAGELLRHSTNEVIVGAMGALKGDPALETLRAVIEHCSQFFYLEDMVAAAVVVPVTVRLKSEIDGAVTLWCGRKEPVEQAAKMVRQLSGAKHVVFDTRIYRGNDLHQVKPARMQEYLIALSNSESGKDVPPLAKPVEIRSVVDADWETVYFVGVALHAQGDALRLEQPAIQARTSLWGRHLEWALDQSGPLAWQQGVETTITAHGFWYMRNGLRHGQAVIREGKLRSFIANFEQGVLGVDLVYTVDAEEARIRLLVCSHLMAAEHRWAVYDADDVAAFRTCLEAAVDACIADVNGIREVDGETYEQLAAQRGVVW